MNDKFDAPALEELIQAMSYLDDKVSGLGNALYNEINDAIERIKEQPDRWPLLTDDVHRYRLDRFRYYIIYQIIDGSLLIIAIMHTSRRPGYWKDRVR